MKTAIQMAQDVYRLINVDLIKNIITGRINLFERPKNSNNQDVVVGTLALTSDQLQVGVVNVNLHFPNLNVTIDGSVDDTQPDIGNMIAVGNVIISLLKDVNGYDFKLGVSFPGIPIRDVDGTWFLNIRINYSSFQQNFTNI